MATFALLHSIFLSARSWAAVGQELEMAGEQAQVLDCQTALKTRGSYYEEVARIVAGQLSRRSVLVAHSAAGATIPAIVTAAKAKIAGVTFVDALLPHPGQSWLDTAPEFLRAAISAAATRGHAPPWPQMLPPALLARLVPDAPMRSAVIAESPRVPRRFLQESAPLLDMPRDMSPCYIQLSRGYEPEADAAGARGWRVSRLAGDHLWPLTHPREVARALQTCHSPL